MLRPAEIPQFPLREAKVSGSSLLLLLVVPNGDIEKVAPWQLTPPPYVLSAKGPCRTWTA